MVEFYTISASLYCPHCCFLSNRQKRTANELPAIALSYCCCHRENVSRPVSRVLSWTVIHLGCVSPHTSSDLPGNRAGHTLLPYLVLLRVGFALPPLLPTARCALTAPFHPYRPPVRNRRLGRYVFCGTFRRLAPPRYYLAPCPVEPGLSSPPKTERLSGRLSR
jgi:hypothetical protein